MTTDLLELDLLAGNLDPGGGTSVEGHAELEGLASLPGDRSARSLELFKFFRKQLGQSALLDNLMEIQAASALSSPMGARLLAAFLDVTTPGARLIPRLLDLSSSRRFALNIEAAHGTPGNLQRDWLQRFKVLEAYCIAGMDKDAQSATGAVPGSEMPWPRMKMVLSRLLDDHQLEAGLSDRNRAQLVALLRLEVDAWQERISHLAGTVNPFRVEAVARLLPLLNAADAEIRDLRQLTGMIDEGDHRAAFVTPLSRSLEIFDDKERDKFRSVLQGEESLAPLAALHSGLCTHPAPVDHLAGAASVIQHISARMEAEGLRNEPLNLLTAVSLAQSHYGNGQVVIPAAGIVEEFLAGLLMDAATGSGGEDTAGLDLTVVTLQSGLLVIETEELGTEFEHDLPVAQDAVAGSITVDSAETDVEEDEDDAEDLSASAIKQLVLNNIQSVSVILGFLRNPRVVSIPGLVEDVVNRARNPQIIETVAIDRSLHTGFANRGVALACLRSPVNVSVKILRKFIHVKYVSKVDLKRMAVDRTGIRKEVGREIEKYLQALA